MDHATRDFLRNAQDGDPVFITDVRKAYLALPDAESFPLTISLVKVDGGGKIFPLRFPRFGQYPDTGKRFVTEYFLATVYNILSSLGGRSLTLTTPEPLPEVDSLRQAFLDNFGLDLATHQRRGYGRSLNVIERMLPAVLPDAPAAERRFRFHVVTGDAPVETARPGSAATHDGAATVFRQAALGLEGKLLLGIDIGGTDIKLVLSADGQLTRCKEFDWYPAAFTSVEQFIHPVRLLVRLLSYTALARHNPELAALLEPALSKHADVPAMEKAVAAAESLAGGPGPLFDAIGLSFPDVVVEDKIVGGEVSKVRGIRNALGAGFDQAFTELTRLDAHLAAFVKPAGGVGIINDGPMAAFTAGVEAAVNDPGSVAAGVFAHTLGTELGTGWVTENGDFPDIPLEVYNFIVDLGSYPEREFERDDLRSLNNLNTDLPGTLQKYTSQSGVFRLALKYLALKRPDLMRQMLAAGFVTERPVGGGVGLYVPTEPQDLRKPFLEYMMALVEKDDDPDIARVFTEIGVSLAVAGKEVDYILEPAARTRTLFGRLVKRASCFKLMEKGALAYDPEARLAVADDAIAETGLMLALRKSEDYTIAQFAQAVGAVYYANYRLLRKGVGL